MKGYNPRSDERRSLLRLIPVALAARLMPAQQSVVPQGIPRAIQPDPPDDGRLVNGKSRLDAIARVDYEQNVRDARDLIDVAKSFEEDLEKDDRFVLSLSSLKKLDEIEKLAKKIRGRMKRF
jgi:hypothetical protein